MSDGSRTRTGDIASVGAELEESMLCAVSGGVAAELKTWQDPPGVCKSDTFGT